MLTDYVNFPRGGDIVNHRNFNNYDVDHLNDSVFENHMHDLSPLSSNSEISVPETLLEWLKLCIWVPNSYIPKGSQIGPYWPEVFKALTRADPIICIKIV